MRNLRAGLRVALFASPGGVVATWAQFGILFVLSPAMGLFFYMARVDAKVRDLESKE